MEVITLAPENRVDIICLPPHSSHKNQPLDRTFHEAPGKHYAANKLKNGSFQIQGYSSPSNKLANYSEIHTIELQQALLFLFWWWGLSALQP
jgi:hypothetical protein